MKRTRILTNFDIDSNNGLTLCPLGNFPSFHRLLIFSKSTFSKISFRNTVLVSNRLDQDQALHFVGPDLGPICSQRLCTDDTYSNSVARTLKKLCTSKGEYCTKQWFSPIAYVFKIVTRLKGKDLPPSGANSFL